jgi:hypothetical protein
MGTDGILGTHRFTTSRPAVLRPSSTVINCSPRHAVGSFRNGTGERDSQSATSHRGARGPSHKSYGDRGEPGSGLTAAIDREARHQLSEASDRSTALTDASSNPLEDRAAIPLDGFFQSDAHPSCVNPLKPSNLVIEDGAYV